MLRAGFRRSAKNFVVSGGGFAVLYRQHGHREELVQELAERGIPFSIEGLDVLDTPEVRDVLACLSTAANPKDAANLFRVAALPQFEIDPRGTEGCHAGSAAGRTRSDEGDGEAAGRRSGDGETWRRRMRT